MYESNFLVIGTGVAGLSFALRAAEHGRVVIITKADALHSSSAKAQGGIAAVMDVAHDSFQQHVADTLDAGAGLCDEAVVRTIVQEGPEAIQDLVDYGVHFDHSADNAFELAREGGHTQRRVLHAKDATGHEITSKLLHAARQHPNICLYENHFAIDLITTAKLGSVTENRVLGAYVLNRESGEVVVFRSDRVLLATGGCGRVYQFTTNPSASTGDGVAMAWRAGTTIANMEFEQFHPTCFYNPSAHTEADRSFLISEAVRGEGGELKDKSGVAFMTKYDPRGSLAPRDITARAVDTEIKRTGSPSVYLDVTHKPPGFMRERFPMIYEMCCRYGIDPEVAPIPVVPAAHFSCGGVQTDDCGKSDIVGLYVAGEAGCTGLHGANRLASNSLLECVVVAKRAMQAMLVAHPLQGGTARTDYVIPAWQSGHKALPDELAVIYHNWDEIRRLMWDYVSIVRTNKRLQRAAARLRLLRNEVREFYWGYRVTAEILELRNLVDVASLIVDCAIRRHESRGLHFNTDTPHTDTQPVNTIMQPW